MIEADWRIYGTRAEMAEAVADEISAAINTAIATRGEALVALPGGKSPLAIFERLAKVSMSWNQVTILPTDDRLVPAGDPLSNAATIASYFLPKGARVFSMARDGTADYHSAGEATEAELAQLNWPPDLIWIGVGVDGHTASIFPGPDLEEALDCATMRRVVGVMPDPLPREASVARITLSCAAILSARALMLAFAGRDKRIVVERALQEGPLSRVPIGRVLAKAKNPVVIHWSAT
jgi:6-phosphogluconolactonase